MLDIIFRCDKDKKIDYVWFDTGLEYQATKEHLEYLNQKYNIRIQPYKAIKPIPFTCKKYGQPFLSKNVSEFIQRLQAHNFKWEDEPYEVLIKRYPKCKSALQWWCDEKGNGSHFSIRRNKWLKEFMIANHPDFAISNKCCKYAKKAVIHKCLKDGKYDLSIQGVRKAEGGVRATAYKNCFTCKSDGADEYRPIFFYKDSDKKQYEECMIIMHSDCYTVYGLTRTGCSGCPFGKDFEFELEVIKKFEPKLYKAVINIFGASYEYTRRYKEYCKNMDINYGSYSAYLKTLEK